MANTKNIIGYADIVGDLFHSNHIKFLKECKKYCNFLIVGICTDEYCKSYKRKPIFNESERLFLVNECKYVDKCFLVNENQMPIRKEFIDEYKIDHIFHAHTKEEHNIYKKFYEIPIKLNKFIRIDYHDGTSTSSIINSILNLTT